MLSALSCCNQIKSFTKDLRRIREGAAGGFRTAGRGERVTGLPGGGGTSHRGARNSLSVRPRRLQYMGLT